ncbi:phosphoserine phosphatase [Helicobacter pullorum]|uniref:HAD-IB family phosphatase n=1 Tax=Helicobacter pullorum TaxID=35818 RepID=UPI0008169E68|nr:HAD-IB family phosphatase [Helicobacter pullorum]OCR15375.1 phosphoserine phosphatase [Helicobacter pullorum]OCR19116.1 phosphoserine phosphatase [Helicobacter pullorum]
MKKIIFDLDGTLTKEETLKVIARHFGLEKQIDVLTERTVVGHIPFVESFIRRVHLLKGLPIDEVRELLSRVLLHDRVIQLISDYSQDCCVATGNLDVWVSGLVNKIGCEYYSSVAEVKDNKICSIRSILKKETIVDLFKDRGFQVVYIGDGNNDVEAMRRADIAIASGLVHMPSNGVLSVADYVVFSEEALCRLIRQLL